ncbi:hypothetical protein EPO15_06310 [bacterium]|nr:MAG: hypothetical protein EPO15_06310 [bacterium]
MAKTLLLGAALLMLAASPGRSAPVQRSTKPHDPLRWAYADTPEGVRVLVPVVDADPVRGVTAGVMPVWVALSSGGLRDILAPSLTYNATVGVAGNLDYYHFPSSDAVFEAYASLAERSDREVYLFWQSAPMDVLGITWTGQAQHLRDANRRFYGLGPDAPLSAETDYTLATWNASGSVDVPTMPGSPAAVRLGSHIQGVKILPGPRRGIPDVEAKHPGAANGRQRLVDAAFRAAAVYDTRDSKLTASRGLYAEAFTEAARDGWLSDMTYERYGAELKAFRPFGAGPEPSAILAGECGFSRLYGSVPFWTLPSLGGKYSHRGYGDGRFVDHAAATAQTELRLRVATARVSGQPVSFWLDPFFGGGFVAPALGEARMRTVRPFYGAAVRAVVRPQVVGAADFAFGQEGLKVFVDLNYAF